jgi:hypothetical protein
MKNRLDDFILFVGRMNPKHIRLLLAILTLILFVLGAGAPGTGGGIGIKSLTFFGF